eukprot:5917180-Amphidinium_carterae.2
METFKQKTKSANPSQLHECKCQCKTLHQKCGDCVKTQHGCSPLSPTVCKRAAFTLLGYWLAVSHAPERLARPSGPDHTIARPISWVVALGLLTYSEMLQPQNSQ